MARLTDITATGHPDGNRIDLTWSVPADAPPGVRVVRNVDSHPVDENDGVVVAHAVGLTSVTDKGPGGKGLDGERVYYYTLVPFTGDPPAFDPDPHNRTSAMALSPYGFADQLYGLLPAIYRRYDGERTPAVRPDDPAGLVLGQLRGFLDLPGGELDRLYSLLRAALSLTDLDRVDGNLLPLLAGWIGWPTDYGLSVGAQRNEIRFAPRLYQTVGVVPTVDATVARLTGWANATKEFVHNVARTNQPERLNLWSSLRDTNGNWSAPVLTSVNYATDGRPTVVRDTDGALLLFFHTNRSHGSDIWSKRFVAGEWEASVPVVDRPGVDANPTAAVQGGAVRLFWQSFDTRWRISSATRTGEVWTDPATFGDPTTERRAPAAVADNTGGVWLFWLEKLAGVWQIRYNRHNGTTWQLTTPATFPLDAGVLPRAEDDLHVLFHPNNAGQRLWVFWARHEPGGPAGQTRWTTFYRVKAGLDPNAGDWSVIRQIPKAGAGGYHDRLPVALPSGTNVEAFWSTTQNGGWSVTRNTVNAATFVWGANQQITTGAYTRRAPVAVDTGSGVLLVYRANDSIPRRSTVFGATTTLDHSYAGTTTVDTGATDKLHARGTYEDFLTYTYDTARTNDDRIARDTVGLYLTPNTADPAVIADGLTRLAGALPDFMPVTARAVFVPKA
jgi:hypothetical protein